MAHHPEWGRFARVIASDLVEYFRAPDSPFALSEPDALEFASHGLYLLRARYGSDDALEQYYADCIGGAFLKYLDGQGILEPDDYDDMNTILPAIASAEGPERDHGTVQERFAATRYGLDNGLSNCSVFFPNAPLIT